MSPWAGDFPCLLYLDVGAFVGVDVLLALTGHIGQDKVIRILLPIVLVVVQGKAVFLHHTQHICQLVEVALVLVAGGFANTDKATAVVDKFTDCGRNYCILPFRAAGMGSIAVTDVDDDIDGIQNCRILADVIEVDELHTVGGTGQGLDDTCIGVVLLLVKGMVHYVAAPGTHPAPAVQHGNRLGVVSLMFSYSSRNSFQTGST